MSNNPALDALINRAGNAQVSADRQYLEPGMYRFTINELKAVTGGNSGELFISSHLTVMESNNGTPPGADRFWTIKAAWRGSEKDLKAFVAAGFGFTDEAQINTQINAEVIHGALSPQNPLKGRTIVGRVSHRLNESNTKIFTKHVWTADQGQPLEAFDPSSVKTLPAQAPAPMPTHAPGYVPQAAPQAPAMPAPMPTPAPQAPAMPAPQAPAMPAPQAPAMPAPVPIPGGWTPPTQG